MNKEVISDKQGISLVILFIIGESLILISSLTAEKDIWLAIILSIFMALPLMFVYCRLFNIFPNKDFFDIIDFCFGKFIGKGIIILYTWYTFDLAALVLRDVGQFIITVNISETPIIVPMICIMILCAWIVKQGIEVMGRWGELFVMIPISLAFILIIFLIPDMNLNNIRPVLYNGIKPVIKGGYESFIYPFGETIIFTVAFSALKSKKSIYKIYIKGLLIGGTFLLATSLTIVLVLGINNASHLYFPGYETVKRINIGTALQRIEVIAAILFLLGVFIKVSIYLLVTCKGVAKLLRCKDYRLIVIPISLQVVNLAYFEFDSIMSFNEWIFDVWIYYAFLFMVILPIIILIVAEIKKNRLMNNKVRNNR